MKHRPAIHSQRNRRKWGVNFVMVGRDDPSNSDNLNGDGGVCVRACVRACVRECVRAFVMCLPYTIYNN